MLFFDIHTHNIIPQVNHNGDDIEYILNTYPDTFAENKALYAHVFFSCGIHPWYSDNSEDGMDELKHIVKDDRVLAIGEAGLDKMRGPSLNIQRDIFKKQIILAEDVRKPILIHCVKAWDELISLRKESELELPWVIHGFRGALQQAKQLIKQGFYLSLGHNLNREVLQNIPLDRIFLETDDTKHSIIEVYEYAADILHIHIMEFSQIIEYNIKRIFPIK